MAFDQFGSTYDFPRYLGRQATVYMIASTPRSGSHFLGHLLFATGKLGSPLEYFNQRNFETWSRIVGTRDATAIVREIMRRRTAPTGWFGFKAHWEQFEFLRSLGLSEVMNISRTIWIRRRDLVDQAISLAIASQTGNWTNFHDAVGTPKFNSKSIYSTALNLRRSDDAWARYFASNKLTPRTVIYEDLSERPGEIVGALLNWFGLAPLEKPVVPPTTKQASQLNRQWKAMVIAAIGNDPTLNRVDLVGSER